MTMLRARAIAADVAAGHLTAREALSLGDDAIARREETLQVFAHRAETGMPGTGPLAGIAVGVKDIFDTRDMPTGHGSPIYRGHRPVADASLVAMLRDAGATVAGKTVTTEFAWFQPGPTRNPHNEAHTPGGSSSGSAAGVAAGYFPAAIGSQTGGSVVRPAAFCGVAGYKPSFRLFPTVGMKQFSWLLDTAGFFAATTADVAFVAAACSHRALEVRQTDDAPRIGIYRSSIDGAITPAMADAVRTAADRAAEGGATVVEVTGPEEVEAARAAHAPIQDHEAYRALADERRHHRDLLSPKLRDYLDAAADVGPERYDDARRTANRARKAAHGLFADCDVLLMPSAPGAAPHGLETTGDSAFNRLWTLLGLPCLNVPGLRDGAGMPLGMQLVAPFGRDAHLLQAGDWLERHLR